MMKHILIFGATSTIAQEVAKLYAKQSCRLILVGRNQVNLDIIRQDLEVRGAIRVDTICHDLNDLESHKFLTEQAWEK